MNRWVALFRGINVGGNHKVPMAELRALSSDLGFDNPQTYIQSGNLVFGSDEKDGSKLESQLATAVERRFGFHPLIIMRSAVELASAIKSNPFAAKVKEGKELHIYFLDADADKYDEAAVNDLAIESEEFALKDGLFYLFAPEGVGRSKLAEKLPKYLPKRHTARNLNSVKAILDLANTV